MQGTKTLHSYYSEVDLTKLSFVRESKGFTKKHLAELLSLSPSLITQYELGKVNTSFETYEHIIKTLNIHPKMLTGEFYVPKYTQCHYRANKKVSQTERKRAETEFCKIHKFYKYFEQEHGIGFPEVKYSTYEKPTINSTSIINSIATDFRESLGLGLGPIRNMASLIEALGIRIVFLDKRDDGIKLDAFTTTVEGIPYIAIDGSSASSRMQFDYAHELAHVLFDEDSIPEEIETERRANYFAGAFLMPEESFYEDCPASYSLHSFCSVKKHWAVSIQAALFRGKQLGKISENKYKSAIINFSKYRKNEPCENELIRPVPTLLAQALEATIEDGFDINDMSEEVAMYPYEIRNFFLNQGIAPELVKQAMGSAPVAKVIDFNAKITKK